MSENTLNAALRRLGYTSAEMCAHGFRTTATSLLNKAKKWPKDAIERQMQHSDNDQVRKIYNRWEYWEDRIEMMNWWADHLDELRIDAIAA